MESDEANTNSANDSLKSNRPKNTRPKSTTLVDSDAAIPRIFFDDNVDLPLKCIT